MIYHVLPGDAHAEAFSSSGISGDVIIFREAFISGPIGSTDLNEFWDARAHFVLSEYGEDEIAYQEKVADEILRLSDIAPDDEVNLWFEYELFCSVNLWYCLSELRNSGATLFRISPADLEPDDVWKGFGGHSSDDMKAAFEQRVMMTPEDIAVGADLWDAYRKRDGVRLLRLSDVRSPAFPFLKEVATAAADIDSAPLELVRQIRSEGYSSLEEVFAEFQRRAGLYGFGDLQVEHLLNSL